MIVPEYDDRHLFFGLLFMNGNRLQALGDRFYEEITAKQWLLLAVAELFQEQPPTLRELSEAAGCSHQNAKQLALKLRAKGYLAFEEDPSDRRKSRIVLTESCRAMIAQYHAKQDAFLEALFCGIDVQDLRRAVAVMLRLQENMERMQVLQKGESQ